MNTLFINLFGGPGTGKSTLCAKLFADLKVKGIDCEMALEYAKDVVWEESFRKLSNQVYIFGKQHNRLHRLNGKVDVVITDSPLLNSIIYDDTKNPQLRELILTEFSKLNTLNYYIDRCFEYKQNGRVQDLDGAIGKDNDYKQLLNQNNILYKHILLNDDNDNSTIVNEIINRINDK